MSDNLIRMSNAPIDNERALARLWDEYDLAKDVESDTDSDSTWGDAMVPLSRYMELSWRDYNLMSNSNLTSTCLT